MPDSASGVSMTRLSPYFACKPSVTRNTPSSGPTSSPITTTRRRTTQEGLPEEGLPEEGPLEQDVPGEGLREKGLCEKGLREKGLREEGLPEEGLREEGLREEGLLKNRRFVWDILTLAMVISMSYSGPTGAAEKTIIESTASIAGDWNGKLEIGAGMTMPLVFHFKQTESNSYVGSMKSPSQSTKLIDFDQVVISGDEITAQIEKIDALFKGRLNKQTGTLTGTWAQRGSSIPLTMARGAYSAPQRPQEPKAPFPYKTQNIDFKNRDITLAGTLTIPETNATGKAFPCAILLHGSGPHDRDETIFGHKPFLVLADYLTRNGIAVLRYDKRGCAKSTGNYKAATSADFANDGIAAINYLKTCPTIDPKRIGLIGHSEGGVLAPMIGAKEPDDVRFMVLLAASAINGEKILLSQIRDLGDGISTPASTKKDLELATKTYAIIKAEPDNEKAFQKIMAMRKEMGVDKEITDETERKERDSNIKVSIDMVTGPWYRFFLTHEPENDLSKVKCSVLAINGDKDLQVAADENLPVIKKALEAGGNKNIKIEKVPNINHLMQTSSTGHPNEYSKIEETISPKILKLITDWIGENSK